VWRGAGSLEKFKRMMDLPHGQHTFQGRLNTGLEMIAQAKEGLGLWGEVIDRGFAVHLESLPLAR
jgi:hypothetical protein